MKSILVFLLTAMAALAVEPTAEWKNVQQFEVPQPGLIKLSLPAETLDAVRPNLDDLRILDGTGREVPYLIERPVRATDVVRRAKGFNVTLSGQSTVILIETGVTQPIERLTLETPASGFIKAVTVEGSNDQQRWQALASGQPIFREPNGASQLSVKIPEGEWRFLRVTVDDRRAEAIPFTAASLQAVKAETAPAEPASATMIERTEIDGQTRLVLDLRAARLTVASLRFETGEPLFTRAVSIAVRQVVENAVAEPVMARDTIYRVAVEGFPTAERVEVPLDLNVPYRELVVWIENGDNQPLQISAVRVARRPAYVVFLAQQSGAYQVLTGNPRCAAPRYDVASLAGTLRGAAATALKMSPLARNPGYRPGEALPEIQDLGTALDTTNWTYRKRVQLTRPGVQQLDLDLDVLSHADASFRDLRLICDGKQRPYILERTSISRKLALEVLPANDAKRPTLSRWLIKLPHYNLPLNRLTCTTRTPLFRRQVTLSEQPTDERGEKYSKPLGQATWERTPPVRKTPLELTLNAPPLTDSLILETDNRDNPPIELENFQLFHPVTRVLFKAPPEPPTYLYYGNSKIGFPQYDLDLVVPRLLAEEKTVVSLSTEEPLKKSSLGGLFQLSRTSSIIFWGALALVVIVLLLVISRLLPKTPHQNSTEHDSQSH